jgi:hypothetical protein
MTELFEPDVLLPSQYAAQRQSAEVPPELALMLAVAETALADLTSGCDSIRADAWRWLESNDAHPFSLVAICDVFGWDADVLREGVHGMLRRARS